MCGNFIAVKNRLKINYFSKKVHRTYFWVKFGQQDKTWPSHIVCSNYKSTLLRWTKGERSLTFGILSVWREPKDQTPTKCYFFAVKTVGITSTNKHLIKYPNLLTAMSPVPHSADIQVTVFKGFFSKTWDSVPAFNESVCDTNSWCRC